MTGHGMFFDSWYSFGRIIVTTAIGYVCLVALLRVTGKKTLTKMNVADFVFVVAIGDLLSNGIMTKDITLTDILLGLVLLILLRLAFQHVAQRSEHLEKILNGKPVLLFRDGKCLDERLRENDVSPEELLAAMRQENVFDKNEVEAVILETDGTFSVVKKSDRNVAADETTLTDVEGAREWRRDAAGGRLARVAGAARFGV